MADSDQLPENKLPRQAGDLFDPSSVGEPTIASDLPAIAPDAIEQDFPDLIDNIVPTRGYGMIPLIGLGGSAGSIPALQRFFSKMPTDTGMAFVVILHLAPEHESILDTILGKATTMLVVQAQDGQKVEINTVYVIPPGRVLTANDGHLKLTPLEHEHGKRVTVDLFFRTLADTHGAHAAAVVLSGADGDGALGIKRIKERGGLTIAQDPEEAEHPSMPRSSISTGMVDWVLPVGEIPERLLRYLQSEARLQLPSEEGPQPALPLAPEPAADETALRDVLTFLRTRTGRDFSYYKRATVVRRISRRMQVNGTNTVGDYLSFLRTHPGETGALQQDLLISVTNFFRDREVFAALEALLPAFLEKKGVGDTVRVWTVACATGEEAYSVAMLLLERTSLMAAPPTIQVFATDVAADAITFAREGLYPLVIAADVSEDRLRRFFIREHGGYRARRELRECVLFAVHDVLKDPPFSRLDLITCRNLLIYLTQEAQERALGIFHFALRPPGYLLLGTSETADEQTSLFLPLDKKHRIYHQRPGLRALPPLAVDSTQASRVFATSAYSKGGLFPQGVSLSRKGAKPNLADEDLPVAGRRAGWEEFHFRLLERFSPPSVIITREYDLVHVSESAGPLLHFASGQPSLNLLQVIHPMLRMDLRATLFRAAESGNSATVYQIPVELEGKSLAADIHVSQAPDIAADYFLVVFDVQETSSAEQTAPRVEHEPAVRQIERELEQTKRRLREAVEQYETNVEEMKAGNEELSTVNQELKSKVDELAHANSDLANLMSATGVATIFLGRDLQITRYTPSAVELFRLIPSDLGRPLADLTHGLQYPELREDAERVLETLARVKREVSDGSRWFLAQLHPYRTANDHIAGLVLSFIDISETRKAREALIDSESRLQRAIAIETVGVVFVRTDGQITETNDAFLRMSGYTREDLEQGRMRSDAQTAPEYREQSLQALENFRKYGRTTPYTKQCIRQDGTRWWALFAATRISEDEGVEYVIDITEQKRIEEALRENEERLRLTIEAGNIGTCDWNYQTGEMRGNEKRFEIIGLPPTQSAMQVEEFLTLVHPDDRERVRQALFRGVEERGAHSEEYRVRWPDGTIRWIIEQGRVVEWTGDKPLRISSVLFDLTDRQRIEEALRKSEEQLRLVVANARDYAIFSMDLNRRILSWNVGAQAILGYTEEEIRGRSGDLIFTAEDRAAGAPEAEARQALTEGRATDERWHLRQNGSAFWGSGAMMAMRDVRGEAIGLLKIFRDETEQLHAKEELEKGRAEIWAALQETQQAREEAESAAQAKDHFLAVLSHELRTPLTPVLMAVRTLNRLENLPPVVRTSLEMIQRNVQLEAHFIDDLLDLTRISRGKLELHCQAMNLHEAVRHAVDVAMPDLLARQQRLSLDLAAPDPTFQGDATRLQQVVWNLLKNAAKFTPRGGEIHVRTRREPGSADEPSRLLLEVADTGIGFDEEAGSRIFDAFSQGSQAITREFGGLGLGLAISKASVEAHGGCIRAYSAGVNEGATFTVELPLTPSPEQS